MEIKTTLIAVYLNIGHPSYPEDTFEREGKIRNPKDLWAYIIDIHKTVARHFSDYPFGGYCNVEKIKFFLEESIEIDGKTFVNKERYLLSRRTKIFVYHTLKRYLKIIKFLFKE